MNNNIDLIIIAIVYIVGFPISLFSLHKWKNELSVNNYDPPHDDWYDDWESNAYAYLWFSFVWPIFWSFQAIYYLFKLMLRFSKFIENKTK